MLNKNYILVAKTSPSYHLLFKCLFGLSAKAIDVVLTLLAKAFPDGNKVPASYFEAQKKLFVNLDMITQK